MAALSGIEMGLDLAGIPHQSGDVVAAMTSLRNLGAARENKEVALA